MSADDSATNPAATDSQPVTLSYLRPSELHADHLHLFGHLKRMPVQFNGRVNQALIFRDALATLFAIVSSDYRYIPKDRSAYVAYMQMRRSYQNKGLFKAQQAYFDWLFKNDPLSWCLLDPVISVHPDKLLLEVFSKDEGCYATLSFAHSFFEAEKEIVYGTTNIDFSVELAASLEQMRSFRDTTFSIGQQAVGFDIETGSDIEDAEHIEKRIQVPRTWLRGFLQIQSAAQLATDHFALTPITLYNCLHYLRMHADQKGQRRGLRIELVPQQAPRLVLEPSNVVFTDTDTVYQGRFAKVVRIWGRRRLALLKRFLPYCEQINVRLLGNGMPSFWTLQGQDISLTLAITGFTASNWSQALNFDLLLPRRTQDLATLTEVNQYLQSVYVASLADIAQATSIEEQACKVALQQACQQGFCMFDSASNQYRYRPLLESTLAASDFQFRQPAEALAYDLVGRQQAVQQLSIQVIPKVGIEISAEIKVTEDKRTYLSRLKLNEEDQITRAECSCEQILQHGLKNGPCSHLIALRLAHAEHEANRDLSEITQETKIFTRRHNTKEEQLQISLNEKRVSIIRTSQPPKPQQFSFNSIAQARQAYLDHISGLLQRGYIEG